MRSSSKKIKCNCGATGCVIYPGINCSGTPCVGDKCKEKVTKLFFGEKNLNDEIAIFDMNNKLLQHLDPDENYFLSSYKKCQPIGEEKVKEDCKGKFKQQYQAYTSVYGKKETPIPEAEFEDEDADDISYEESNRRVQRNNKLRDEIARKERESTRKKIEKTFNTINITYLGRDMEAVLEELAEEKIISFLVAVENIFHGIKILNENEFYHCDIKPKNLVLDKDNKFKIIDFGIAFYQAPKIQVGQPKNGMDGMTPGFASPEYYDLVRNDFIQGLKDEKSEEFNYLYEFGNRDIKANSTEIKFKLTLPGIAGPIKEESENINYYSSLNPIDRYKKNDIWAMGCVLKSIYKKIYDMNSDADILNELLNVISKLLVLNVENRPSPGKSLILYQAFLEKISPKSVKKSYNSLGGTRKSKKRTNKRRTNKRRTNKRRTNKRRKTYKKF